MKIVIIALALAVAATPVLAQAPAGSNIGLTDYPAPKCQRPVLAAAQPKPLQVDTITPTEAEFYNDAVKKYNAALKTYNADMESFNSCIQTYMTNGNADMVRIRDALAAAVAMTNAK